MDIGARCLSANWALFISSVLVSNWCTAATMLSVGGRLDKNQHSHGSFLACTQIQNQIAGEKSFILSGGLQHPLGLAVSSRNHDQ